MCTGMRSSSLIACSGFIGGGVVGMCGGLAFGDAAEQAPYGVFDVAVGGETGCHVDERQVDHGVAAVGGGVGEEMAVEPVGFAHAAACGDAVDGVAQAFFGY